jgi:hypothetical protein
MSRTNVRFALCLLLICSTAAVVPASAQHFKQIPGSLSYIAAGRNEVWGLQFPGGLIWRFNPSTQSFNQVPGSLAQIAVGGGTLLLPDAVWGTNGGSVFSFNLSTNAHTQRMPTAPPGSSYKQVAVGEGYADVSGCHPYEVWFLAGIGSSGAPWRYNYCQNVFVEVPLPSATPFTHIATGGGDIWALDADARIWHFDTFNQGWNEVLGGYGGTLQQITVGVSDVWGLDGNGAVYRFDPYSQTFVMYLDALNAGSPMQIAAGGDGVWVFEGPYANNGLRYDSLNGSQNVGSFWTQVAVGSGAGVWVLNTSSNVYTWVRP